MLGKISSEKSAKNVFLNSHEYRDQKMGDKTREKIFPETNYKCDKKIFRKKSSGKSAKNVFLYSHKYRDQKMGE